MAILATAVASANGNGRWLFYKGINRTQSFIRPVGALQYDSGVQTGLVRLASTIAITTTSVGPYTLTPGYWWAGLAIGAFTGTPALKMLVANREDGGFSGASGANWQYTEYCTDPNDRTATPENPIAASFTNLNTTFTTTVLGNATMPFVMEYFGND
jgi:hypothetical protein